MSYKTLKKIDIENYEFNRTYLLNTDNQVCSWAHSNMGKKICLTGGVNCLGFTVDVSMTGTIVDCDTTTIKIKDITGNISGQDINIAQWPKTKYWDDGIFSLTYYAANAHPAMWSSNNDGKGFGWYNNIPIVGSVFLQNLGLTSDNPPKLSIGVSNAATFGYWVYCNSNNQISTNC